jgi:hypothetical protein
MAERLQEALLSEDMWCAWGKNAVTMQAIAASDVPSVNLPPPRKSSPRDIWVATWIPYLNEGWYIVWWYIP